MPETGSPTETMPSRCPSECRQGTNSSSPGTQASGLGGRLVGT